MIRDCIARALAIGTTSILIALVSVAGLGFLVSAAYLELATHFSASEAAALTGAGLIVAGSLAGLILRFAIIRPAASRRMDTSSPDAGHGGSDLPPELAELGAAARRFTRQRPGTAAAAAFAIGAVLGTSPALRQTALDLMRQNRPSR